MRKSIATLVLALSPLVGWAAPPTDDSLIELFRLMKAEAMMESIQAAMEPMMRQSMAQAMAAGAPQTDEDRRISERVHRRMSEVIRAELGWGTLLPLQMTVYRENFDQTEVDGLIAFYSSPVGQSYVSKMPLVTQKAMLTMQAHVERVMPRIKAALDQALAEAKAATPK